MRTSCNIFIIVFYLLFGLVLVKCRDEFTVPPLDVSQEALLEHMNFGVYQNILCASFVCIWRCTA